MFENNWNILKKNIININFIVRLQFSSKYDTTSKDLRVQNTVSYSSLHSWWSLVHPLCSPLPHCVHAVLLRLLWPPRLLSEQMQQSFSFLPGKLTTPLFIWRIRLLRLGRIFPEDKSSTMDCKNFTLDFTGLSLVFFW